jgi:hypothetical protein
MRLRGKLVSEVIGADIEELVHQKVCEGVGIEYKRDLPGSSDSDKGEFLADVSALANTQGGVLLYGIDEERDSENRPTGIPGNVVGLGVTNPEQEVLRLQNMLRDGLDPRLAGVVIRNVEVGSQKVLVVAVPHSLQRPHAVWFRRSGKFHGRTSSGKYQMDVREIRDAFLETDAWERRADAFRAERVAAVRAHRCIPSLDVRRGCFLHLLPLQPRGQADLTLGLDPDIRTCILPFASSACDYRYNVDGFLLYAPTPPIRAYVQYFRNGGLELYAGGIANVQDRTPGFVDGHSVELRLRKAIVTYVALLPRLGVEGPLAVYLSLFGLSTLQLQYSTNDPTAFPPDHNVFDRLDILLPGVLLEQDEPDLARALVPLFDGFWQAGGWPRSPVVQK